ncbi:MAG: hypothetical protein ACHQ4J_01960 [Candidatus Binatia bacterium]
MLLVLLAVMRWLSRGRRPKSKPVTLDDLVVNEYVARVNEGPAQAPQDKSNPLGAERQQEAARTLKAFLDGLQVGLSLLGLALLMLGGLALSMHPGPGTGLIRLSSLGVALADIGRLVLAAVVVGTGVALARGWLELIDLRDRVKFLESELSKARMNS